MPPVSLAPSAQSEFAGLDGPHLVKTARVEEFDYTDKEGNVVAHSIGLMLRCVSESGDERAQFYSIGPSDRWRPTDDGKGVDSVSGDNSRGPSKNCTCSIFNRELDNAGFNTEEELADGDYSVLDGIILDFFAKALPKVSGGEKVTPMPSKVLALPGEKNDWRKKFADAIKGSSSGSKRAARGSAASSASSGSRRKKGGSRRGSSTNGEEVDIDAAARGYMLEVLEEYEEIDRDELADLILKKARKDDNRKEIVARVYEEDFLSHYPDDWAYEKKTVYALEEEDE